jgi:hypothetical protein
MSIKIMQEVWENAPVDQGTLLVLLALADSADEVSRTCYPGIDGLAKRSRLSERQVQYCIQRLRQAGVVIVSRNASPVKTNLYRITQISAWDAARDAIIAPHGKGAETQSAVSRYEVDCVSDTQLVAPKPSVTVSIEPSVAREGLFSEEEAPKKERAADAFERFWQAYPKKVKKPDAQKAWVKAIKAADPDKIIAAVEVYSGTDTVQRGFILNPTSFLNSKRFNDADVQPSAPSTRKYTPPVHEEVYR